MALCHPEPTQSSGQLPRTAPIASREQQPSFTKSDTSVPALHGETKSLSSTLLKLGSLWAPSQLSPSCKPFLLLFPAHLRQVATRPACRTDQSHQLSVTPSAAQPSEPCQQGKPCPGADTHCHLCSCDSSPAGSTHSAQKSLETTTRGRRAGGRHLSVRASMSTATKSSSDLPQWMSFKKTPMTSVVGEFHTPGIIASPGAFIIRVATRN